MSGRGSRHRSRWRAACGRDGAVARRGTGRPVRLRGCRGGGAFRRPPGGSVRDRRAGGRLPQRTAERRPDFRAGAARELSLALYGSGAIGGVISMARGWSALGAASGLAVADGVLACTGWGQCDRGAAAADPGRQTGARSRVEPPRMGNQLQLGRACTPIAIESPPGSMPRRATPCTTSRSTGRRVSTARSPSIWVSTTWPTPSTRTHVSALRASAAMSARVGGSLE